jgi:hypothetical protein
MIAPATFPRTLPLERAARDRVGLLHSGLIPSRVFNPEAIQRKLGVDETAFDGQQKAFGIFSNGAFENLFVGSVLNDQRVGTG